MPIISIRKLTLYQGSAHPIFNELNAELEPNARIALVGRNGVGKSTFLRLLASEIEPDDGELIIQDGLRIAMLNQVAPKNINGTVRDIITSGLPAIHHDDDIWSHQSKVDKILSRLSLSPDQPFKNLSGGLQRRVLLGQALATEPDLLLLDEPTNHLDITAIEWLEQFLQRFRGAVIVVTHDRYFLDRVATQIMELDRGKLFRYNTGNYETFLSQQQKRLDDESQANALFDKKLAQEEVWIRQGIKARRTRNEGRVRDLKALREARAQRQTRQDTAQMAIGEAEKSGRLVLTAKHLSFAYTPDTPPLFQDFSMTVMRGDKIGVIGPNGVGKSTFIKVLLGELEPTSGTIKHGTRLEIAYFDQSRTQLDDNLSIIDNVAHGREYVEYAGKSMHIMTYLARFLFSPERARAPITRLSGGERNRLLLAKLFTKPSNVLVLDEPTNDLDLETLALLEAILVDYAGTVILISHDRMFINHVVSSTLVFDGKSDITEYVGGYDDYLRQATPSTVVEKPKKTKPKQAKAPKNTPSKKLSFKERERLATLPDEIDTLETEIADLTQQMADRAFYQQDPETIKTKTAQLENQQAALAECYATWDALEQRQASTPDK